MATAWEIRASQAVLPNQSLQEIKMVASKSLPPFTKRNLARFWGKVDKTKGHGPRGTCWIWIGTKHDKGYGTFYYSRTTVLAHRFSNFIATGVDPGELDVLHKCNNPSCVRPGHLRVGTHQQNMDDRDRAGRQVTPHGMDHPIAKLTDDDVKNIRATFARGIYTKADLARGYNVSHRLIRNIINRTAWKHI